MKVILKRMSALVLAAAIMVMPASAYFEETAVLPGEKYGVPYSEFYDSKGNSIDSASDFTDKNFAVVKKTISKGSNLVKSIKINNRSHEVDITFTDAARTAPSGPNVIISSLAVRSTRSVKDGSYTIIKSGTTYTYDGELAFRVGMENNDREMIKDGDTITLFSGDTEYVRWVRGDSYGNVTVEYGDIAYATGRVLENDKVMYSFSDEVHEDLLDRNPNAYIQGLEIKGTSFPNSLKLFILANKGDYIYENNEGQLKSASGLKWDSDEDAWVTKITKGKSYIISDTKLRSAPYGSGIDEDDDDDDDYVDRDYDDEESSSSKPSNNYYNPDTGGGSGSVVAVSAIVAILAIAIVSVVMSTILSSKNIKKQ